jgi:Helix-turn-helix domain
MAPGYSDGAVTAAAVAYNSCCADSRVGPAIIYSQGSRHPRKANVIKHSKELLGAAAFQIGVLVAVERNRCGLRQSDLGQAVGIDQVAISQIENGISARGVADGRISALFKRLGLEPRGQQADFIRWWRDHG